jgi:Protein of unknown function (DUF2505)
MQEWVAMSRSFDVVTESPATVEEIFAAFGREEYWLARIAVGGGDATTLDSLTVGADDTVTVRVSQRLTPQLLPAVLAKRVRGDLKISNCETWKPVGDRQVRGQVSVAVSGGLGSGNVDAWLEPASNGSQLRYAVKVAVKIPLLGGKFEQSIGAGLVKSIPAVQRFTDEWIAEHA